MAIRRWEPFSDLMSLREAMDRLFEESFVRPTRIMPSVEYARIVPVDMYQTPNEIVVKASLPGIKPEDVDISVIGDTLTIKGQTKSTEEVKEENFIRRELRYGAFEREMTLPASVQAEKAEASFENGVLTLKIPKAEEAKPKQIKVRATG
ncbi:MAG: Hsp20/alpha crystallin family protein [Chloroflexi bacterium]|nr:Hsp20/alpha crystallin family protein [Chloroflexota bacterium]